MAKRVDGNQREIVAALREAGATVQCMHQMGKGCPDLLCAINGQVFLIEIKDGAKPPSGQKLTPDQIIWHRDWQAEVHVVNSIEAAIAVVAKYRTLAGQ